MHRRADVIHQLLRLGLVGELHVDVMPVILGRGRRFLDGVSSTVALEKLDVTEVGLRTSIRFGVQRPS